MCRARRSNPAPVGPTEALRTGLRKFGDGRTQDDALLRLDRAVGGLTLPGVPAICLHEPLADREDAGAPGSTWRVDHDLVPGFLAEQRTTDRGIG